MDGDWPTFATVDNICKDKWNRETVKSMPFPMLWMRKRSKYTLLDFNLINILKTKIYINQPTLVKSSDYIYLTNVTFNLYNLSLFKYWQ